MRTLLNETSITKYFRQFDHKNHGLVKEFEARTVSEYIFQQQQQNRTLKHVLHLYTHRYLHESPEIVA